MRTRVLHARRQADPSHVHQGRRRDNRRVRAGFRGAGHRRARSAGRRGSGSRRREGRARGVHGELHVALPSARHGARRQARARGAGRHAGAAGVRQRVPALHELHPALAGRKRARHVPHAAHGRARLGRVRAHHLGRGHRRDRREAQRRAGQRPAGRFVLLVHRRPGQAVVGGAHALRRHRGSHHLGHRGHHGRSRRVHGHDHGVRHAPRRARLARLPEFQAAHRVGPQRG